MKNRLSLFQLAVSLFVLGSFLTGCEAIQGIFKAGMWTGIIFVVGIIALVIFIIVRLGKKN